MNKMNNLVNLQKREDFTEFYSDAFSRFLTTKEKKFVIEQIVVEDQRETVHLFSAYEAIKRNPLYNMGCIIEYWDAEYNHKAKVFEVMRTYYDNSLVQYMKKFKNQIITPKAVLNFTQQLFQTLAQVEQAEMSILGLKPSNIFVIDDQNQPETLTIKLGGFVRSDKFLLSKPTYQSQKLMIFVSECINNKQYNILHKYQNKSHAMSFSAIIILVQFALKKDFEEVSNIACWVNDQGKYMEGSMKLEEILKQLEQQFYGLKIFIEQVRQLIVQDDCSGILAMQIYTLVTELRLVDNMIVLGDMIPQQVVVQKTNIQTKTLKQQQKVEIPKPKRCGGGFVAQKK